MTLKAAGRVTAADGTVMFIELEEIRNWGVRLLMPVQDSEESTQQEGPVVWIETRSMRYQLGSPAECYAGVYEALDMQVNTCQVCLNYMYWNPSAEPEFATKEICTVWPLLLVSLYVCLRCVFCHSFGCEWIGSVQRCTTQILMKAVAE